MSLTVESRRLDARHFPRVSGDEPHHWRSKDRVGGFSPRERG